MNVTGEQARNFLGKPTLGGWLTIANCCGWAVVMLWAHWHSWNPSLFDQMVLMVGFLVLSPPLALFCMFTQPLHQGPGDVYVFSVTAGINSMIWGYGIAAIVRWNSGKMNKLRERQRGFEVVPTSEESNHGEHGGYGEAD